jgi:hypothetical protein
MKRKNLCAKCKAPNLLPIPIVPGEEPHIVVGERGMRSVAVRKYVCGQCGYIEEWVDNIDDLAELRKEYGNIPSK